VPSAIAIPLVWRGARGVTPLDRAMRAFDAASAFTSLLPPASLFILVGFPDLPRVRPERSELSLRGPRLEIEAMRQLAREALEPQRPPGLSGRLRRLRPVDWLHLSVALGSGPAVELSFTQRPEVHLDVQVRSREHADPGADGRDAIERVIAGLARAGWKRAIQRA
jgi:hypothetical protein